MILRAFKLPRGVQLAYIRESNVDPSWYHLIVLSTIQQLGTYKTIAAAKRGLAHHLEIKGKKQIEWKEISSEEFSKIHIKNCRY